MCARRIGTEKFYLENPFCCFCGGTVEAVTIEHAPPRVFFKDKQRLKGMEFPSCKRCNNGTADLDQVASLYCLAMGSVFDQELDRDYLDKLIQGVQNNQPEVFDYLVDYNDEAVWDFGHGPERVSRLTINKYLFHDWLNPWAAKQAYAVWYQETSQVLDENICVMVKWYTNDTILGDGVPECLLDATPFASWLQNGRQSSSDQFAYRFNCNLSEQIGMVLIGSHSSAIACAFIMPKTHHRKKYRPNQRGSLFATAAQTGIVSWSAYELGTLDTHLEWPNT